MLETRAIYFCLGRPWKGSGQLQTTARHPSQWSLLLTRQIHWGGKGRQFFSQPSEHLQEESGGLGRFAEPSCRPDHEEPLVNILESSSSALNTFAVSSWLKRKLVRRQMGAFSKALCPPLAKTHGKRPTLSVHNSCKSKPMQAPSNAIVCDFDPRRIFKRSLRQFLSFWFVRVDTSCFEIALGSFVKEFLRRRHVLEATVTVVMHPCFATCVGPCSYQIVFFSCSYAVTFSLLHLFLHLFWIENTSTNGKQYQR